MKQTLAAFVLIFGSHFASASPTSTTNFEDMECLKEASRYVLKELNIKIEEFYKLSFYDGAMVGDGVNAVEIYTFMVKGQTGLHKIEVDVDGCRFRNYDRINN